MVPGRGRPALPQHGTRLEQRHARPLRRRDERGRAHDARPYERPVQRTGGSRADRPERHRPRGWLRTARDAQALLDECRRQARAADLSAHDLAAVVKQMGFLMKNHPQAPGPTDRQLQDLAGCFDRAQDRLDGNAVGQACWGLQRLAPGVGTEALARAIARHVRDCREPLSTKAISNACYGLQSLGGSQQAQELARALAAKIRDSKAVLDAQAIGNACYGLKSLGDSEESRALAQALAVKIAHSHAALDAQAIGNACYGLQSLGACDASQALAQALADKIAHSHAELNAQAIGNAGYGLQSLGDSEASRALAQALAVKITASHARLDAQEIGNAGYGLQSLGNSDASRALAQALAVKIAHSPAVISAQAIGNACYGLQSLGDSEASRALAQALADKIGNSRGELDAQHIGNACYGLQSLGNSDASRALAQALAVKIEHSHAALNTQAIGNACYGLQSLGKSDASRTLARALWDKARQCTEPLRPIELSAVLFGTQHDWLADTPLGAWAWDQLDALAQRVQAGTQALSGKLAADIVATLACRGRFDGVPRAIHRIYRDAQANDSLRGVPSPLEREVQAHLRRAPQPAGSRAPAPGFGRFTYGFETDILLDTPQGRLDIEIDGPSHDQPAARKADELRDRFLQAQGVQVVRIRAADHGFDAGRIAAEVRRRIADATAPIRPVDRKR